MHYSSVRVYGIIMRGTLGDCLYRNIAEKNNKHRITAKNLVKHQHRNLKFCPTINLIESPCNWGWRISELVSD